MDPSSSTMPGFPVSLNGEVEDALLTLKEKAPERKMEISEAKAIVRSLVDARAEEDDKRRSLWKRWPERPPTEATDCLWNSERFVSELYLREGKDSLNYLKDFIQGGIYGLGKADDGKGVQPKRHKGVVRKVAEMSDQDVAEAIPLFLQNLQLKSLRSIFSITSRNRRNTQPRNRSWMESNIKQYCMTHGRQSGLPLAESLQRIVGILRNPKSYKDEPGEIVVVASSPIEAAHCALRQLDQLPLQDLHVMLEVLLQKTPAGEIGRFPVGGNKDRIATAIWEKGRQLLSMLEEGSALPEALRKALVVMSLSARHALGDDGKLMDHLGPFSSEMQLLHNSLLSALAEVKLLNYNNLLLLYKDLVGEQDLCAVRHPDKFRQALKRIFLDCLLRSDVRTIPDKVITATTKINVLLREQSDMNRELNAKDRVVLNENLQMELEATLRVSSHLQQILYDWKVVPEPNSKIEEEIQAQTNVVGFNNLKNSGITSELREITHRTSFVPRFRVDDSPDDQVVDKDVVIGKEDTDDRDAELNAQKSFSKETTDKQRIERDIENAGIQKNCIAGQEYEHIREEKWLEKLTKISDEAAGVGYTLIGCAIEGRLSLIDSSLPAPIKEYLQCGLKRKLPERGEIMENEYDQVARILRTAENIPTVSRRTMDNVKRRLGMG